MATPSIELDRLQKLQRLRRLQEARMKATPLEPSPLEQASSVATGVGRFLFESARNLPPFAFIPRTPEEKKREVVTTKESIGELIRGGKALTGFATPGSPLSGEAYQRLGADPTGTLIDVGVAATTVPALTGAAKVIGQRLRGLRTARAAIMATSEVPVPLTAAPKMPVEIIKPQIELRRSGVDMIQEAGKRTPVFLKQARNRVSSPEAKQLFQELEFKVDPAMQRRAAEELRNIEQAGFKVEGFRRMPKVENDGLLADRLEGKAEATDLSRAVKKSFDRMWFKANAISKQVGAEPMGRIDQYFKRKLRPELAQTLYDDLAPIAEKFRKLGVPDEAANAELVQLIKEGKIKGATKVQLAHLVESRQFANFKDAFDFLNEAATRDVFFKPGFTKHRTVKLTDDAYTRKASDVIPHYITTWAKYVSELETWGKDFERATETLRKLRAINPEEERIARQVLHSWTGQLEIEKPLPTHIKKWVSWINAGTVSAKIGLGFSAFKNVFQPFISYVPEAGWMRSVSGVAKATFSKTDRELGRRSGALNPYLLEAISGPRERGPAGKITEAVMKASGMEGINKTLQMQSAVIGSDFIPELYSTARGIPSSLIDKTLKGTPFWGRRQEWARWKLQQFGVSADEPLTPNRLKEAMYRFATDAQLQRNVLSDPLSRNHPWTRPMWLLKSFGYRQMVRQKTLIMGELSKGNVFPIIRLAQGIAVGGFVEERVEKLVRSVLSGTPIKVDDRTFAGQFVDWMTGMGALGVIGDISTAENKLRQLEFNVTPVQWADLNRGYELLSQVWNDTDADALLHLEQPIPKRPLGEIAQRAIKPLAGFGGAFSRELAKRVETEDQTQDRTTNELKRLKENMFKSAWRGDEDRVQRLYSAWEANHSERRLMYKDISPKEFVDWLVRRGLLKKGEKLPVHAPSTLVFQPKE